MRVERRGGASGQERRSLAHAETCTEHGVGGLRLAKARETDQGEPKDQAPRIPI